MSDRRITPTDEWRVWNLYGNGLSPEEVLREVPGTRESLRTTLLSVHADVVRRDHGRVSTLSACADCGTGTNHRLGARRFDGQYYCLPCGVARWLEASHG